jgi:predicted permease
MTSFWQDLRHGTRLLLRSPGFTIIAVLTLALGIGANTALFSVVNGVLLNPLPYPNPEQLVRVAEKLPSLPETSISYPNFLDWVSNNHAFQSLAAYRPSNFTLTSSGEAQRVTAMRVSASFFSLLGVNPALGRNFLPEEDKRGAAPRVMLSGEFWKSRFGASPEILGKTLTLDGIAYTVVGVIRANFNFSGTNFQLADVYVPIGSWDMPGLYDRSNNAILIYAVGRLKPGVTLAQARANMDSVSRSLAAAYPDADKEVNVALAPLKEHMVQDVRVMLLVLLAAVGLVLLIACANVANLLLARATGRAREFAIRAALGATQQRIVRQLLAESMLLAIAGGVLGLLLASWGTQAALKVLPETLPRAEGVQMDLRVLLFTVAVSILAGLLFGLAPALKTSHPDLHETLKEGGRGPSGARHRTQTTFVVVEMALAVVLLIGAGLMIRSLIELWAVNPGFNAHGVLTFNTSLPASTAKKSPDQVRASLRQLVAAIEGVPGVAAASLSNGALPLSGDDEVPFWVEGQPRPATTSEMPQVLWYMVTPDYLRVMQIPLLRGRFLSEQDGGESQPVGVIDENFAREYFPNEDPVGKRLDFYFLKPIEIVGVVGHVNQWGLDRDANGPVKIQLYTSVFQFPDRWMPQLTNAGLVVRTQTPGFSSMDAIRKAIQQMDSGQVAYGFKSMDEIISDSLAARRFSMILLGAFAAIALALAGMGTYGVVSYVASRRTHEIGIRMALGAQPADVMKLILREGARLALVGVGIGLAASFVLTQLMKAMLFGVSASDPLTFFTVAVVLTLAAMAACYFPTRRAMRVEPMVALRYE